MCSIIIFFTIVLKTSHIEGKKLYEGDPQDHENGTPERFLLQSLSEEFLFQLNDAGLRQFVKVNFKIIKT